ncbi:MAG: porin family protein [Methylobacteriaceae bacterium]|nr:porin family protein [Methylobacteriaceae bacterium]
MRKRILLGSVVAAAMTFSAYAADLPARMAPPPPPPPPVFTWTGFYIGVNGGYISREGTQVIGTPGIPNLGVAGAVPGSAASAAAATFNTRRQGSGLAGGQVGYNWQVNPWAVIGVEGDAQGVFGNNCNNGNNNGGAFGGNGCNSVTNAVPVAGFAGITNVSTNSVNDRMNFLATVRGRLGVLPLPTFMVYATGGVAFGNVNSTVNVFQQTLGAAIPLAGTTFSTCGNNNGFGGGNGNGNCVRVGATAGGGVEWMFLPGWSVKAEALYYDLGRVRTSTSFQTFAVGGVVPFFNTALAAESRPRGVIARAGLNYHFTWGAPAPVVARY